MVIDFFELGGDDFPGVILFDELAAVCGEGRAAGKVGKQIERGLCEDGHVTGGDDDAAIMRCEFIVVAFFGDDRDATGGEGFGDGHGEAFLMGREDEEIGIDEGLPFGGADDLADALDVVLEVVLRDEVVDLRFVGGVSGAGNDEKDIGAGLDDGVPVREETVEAFFGMEAGEEEDEGAVGEFWMGGAEGTAGGKGGDFFLRDAVADDDFGEGGDPGDGFADFGGVSAVEGGSILEDGFFTPEPVGVFDGEAALFDGIFFEHAVEEDDVFFIIFSGNLGGDEGGVLPDGVEMDEIEGEDILLEPGFEGEGFGVAGGAVGFAGVDGDAGIEGDELVCGVADGGDGDGVSAGDLAAGDACSDSGGSAGFGGE